MSRPLAITLVVAAAVAIVWLALHAIAGTMVARRIEGIAAARGLSASWQRMRVTLPARLAIEGLAFETSAGEQVFRAHSLDVSVSLGTLIGAPARPPRLRLAHVRVTPSARAAADPDTLAPAARDSAATAAPLERARARLRSFIDLLLAPQSALPNLEVHDLVYAAADSEAALRGLEIDSLQFVRDAAGTQFEARGRLLSGNRERASFLIAAQHRPDDRLEANARLAMKPEPSGHEERLDVLVQGRLHLDPAAGRITLADSTTVTIGIIPFVVAATLERAAPRIALSLSATNLSRNGIIESLPAAMLGPLRDVFVIGTFDYRLRLDLDFERPEEVAIEARVATHGLALDRARTRLDLALDPPLRARIRLPRGRLVERELSSANPFYRPLHQIDSVLVKAVVTNEDGGFFDHGGFNLGAVKSSIAENLRAGRYRRGAGTITMQLARNLYTGHDRTLSRKAQEVVLAWLIEHLSGMPKERLLEIYLNIIEWGPDVHGAGEAAHYYFEREAAALTVEEALFLCTVVPAPRKWRYRFDAAGKLRGFTREQMHFIGRAMIKKGWLDPALLPPADSLAVELRGAARAALMSRHSTLAPTMRTLEGEDAGPAAALDSVEAKRIP